MKVWSPIISEHFVSTIFLETIQMHDIFINFKPYSPEQFEAESEQDRKIFLIGLAVYHVCGCFISNCHVWAGFCTDVPIIQLHFFAC